jgi:outer membrane protein TolC
MKKRIILLISSILFFPLFSIDREGSVNIIETENTSLQEIIEDYEKKASGFYEISDFLSADLLSKKGPYLKEGLPEEPYNEDDLIYFALRQNTGIHIAQQAIKSSEADLESAKAQRWPKLSTEVSASLIGNPVGPIAVAAGVLGESPGGEKIPPEDILIYKGMENSLYNFALKFEQPIYTWGKISLGIALAKNALSLSYKQNEKTRDETILHVRALFQSLGYVNEILSVLEMQKKLGERLLAYASENRQAGFLTESEYLTIKIRLKEIDIALATSEEQIGSLLSDLSRYTGIANLDISQLDCKPSKIQFLPWAQKEAEEKSIKGNTDLQIGLLASEIRKQEAELAKKQASGIPDIGLQIELSYGGSRFPFLETDWFGQDNWQATISLALQGVFIGNKALKADYIKAVSEAIKTEKQLQEGKEILSAHIRESYLSLSLLETKIEYYQLKQAVNNRELLDKKTQMDMGIISEADFIETMILSLGDLAEAYALLAEHQSKVLTVEMLLGKEAWNP